MTKDVFFIPNRKNSVCLYL